MDALKSGGSRCTSLQSIQYSAWAQESSSTYQSASTIRLRVRLPVTRSTSESPTRNPCSTSPKAAFRPHSPVFDGRLCGELCLEACEYSFTGTAMFPGSGHSGRSRGWRSRTRGQLLDRTCDGFSTGHRFSCRSGSGTTKSTGTVEICPNRFSEYLRRTYLRSLDRDSVDGALLQRQRS